VKRIAVINQKGGVGKTTTTANLGAALGRAGHSVLLLDLDAQTNLSLHLSPFGDPDAGEPPGPVDEPEGPTIFEVLVDIDRVSLASAIVDRPSEHVRLVRASQDLAGIEQALAGKIGRELLLRDAFDGLVREGHTFDFALMDCPPSLGVLSLNALSAADSVLIPLQTEFFALQGLSQLFEVVQVVQQRLNPDLSIVGILPCLVDQRTRLAAEAISEIRQHFGELLFETRVRKSVRLAEAPGFGQSIFSYAPGSPGAEDYQSLTAELLARLGLAKPVEAEPVLEATARWLRPDTAPALPAPAPPASVEPPHLPSLPIEARLAEDGLSEAGMVADFLAGTQPEDVPPAHGVSPDAAVPLRRPAVGRPLDSERSDQRLSAPPATGSE